ncbi:hypothetical protein [Thermodesulfovibrio hydrogeniphilus]
MERKEYLDKLLRRIKGRNEPTVLYVKQYPRDVVIEMHFPSLKKRNSSKDRVSGRPKGSNIRKFSKRSVQRLNFFMRNTEELWQYCFIFSLETSQEKLENFKSGLNSFLHLLRFREIKFVWFIGYDIQNKQYVVVMFLSRQTSVSHLDEAWNRLVGGNVIDHFPIETNPFIVFKNLFEKYSEVLISKPQEIPHLNHIGKFWGSSRGVLNYELINKIVFKTYQEAVAKLKGIKTWLENHMKRLKIEWQYTGFGMIVFDGAKHILQYIKSKFGLPSPSPP